VVRVRTSLDEDRISSVVSPQEWYLDATTGLPLRVEFRVPEISHDITHPLDYEAEAFDFSNYQRVGGMLVPHSLAAYSQGSPKAVIMVTSVNFNQGLSPTEFDAPTGGTQ